MERTLTKKAAMHFDGDSGNSDEGDCMASITVGTHDEDEGDAGEGGDDCDAAAESPQLSDHEK